MAPKQPERRFRPGLELIKLIDLLERAPRSGIKVQELATRLELPERKIYRMLNAIQMDYGISSHNGFYSLPPKQNHGSLTGPEQEKIFTACSLAGALEGTPFVPNLKVLRERFSGSRQRPLLEKPPQLSVMLPSSWPIRYKDFERQLEELIRAQRGFYVVEVKYGSAAKRTTASRLIEPYDFYFEPRAGLLMLFAHCLEETRVRPFMVHRIAEVKRTEKSFQRDKSFSVEDELARRFNLSMGEEAVIQLRCAREVVPFVEERLLREHKEKRTEDVGDGRSEFRFTAPVSDAMVSFVLSFGPTVEVIAPESLRERVTAALSATAALYKQ